MPISPRTDTGSDEPEGADTSASFSSRVAQADAFEKSRAEALADPGPSWRDWFLYHASKWWVALGFFIVDMWILLTFVAPFNPVALGLSLAAAVYLEFLAYRFLWYRWDPENAKDVGPFQATFLRPRKYGIWTPEADQLKRGEMPANTGPRREDFL